MAITPAIASHDATEHMRKDFAARGAVFISALLATWGLGSFGFFQFPVAAHASKNCGKKEQ
jgi:hypothetical protein